jgi:hypothetical protein
MTTGNLHHRATGLAPLLLLAATAPALAADGWQCVASSATGYRYDPDRDRWKTLVIPVADQRFRLVAKPSGRWELVRDGSEPLTLACDGGFDATGWLRCGTGDQFTMNRNLLIFESHLFSADNSGLKSLTALTAAGRCTAR